MGGKTSVRKKLAVFGAVCAGLFLFWEGGTGVADLMGLSGGEEIGAVSIRKSYAGGSGLQDVSFYSRDAGLAGELAAFLEGVECRYSRTGNAVYTLEGQAVYGVEFSSEGNGWRSGRAAFLDDGRVYVDGKCYYLKKEYAPGCITARLEGILRECPEGVR